MPDKDLGPQPEPEIEPGEPHPGGVDAIDAGEETPALRDLSAEDNPAVEDVLPGDLDETEDTSTEATKGSGKGEGEHLAPEDESPA